MKTAPRIYNLFPLLAGSVTEWEIHLPRIADMGFDWIFINPFHLPGLSGSLYAVKDYYRLNPLFQGRSQKNCDDLLRGFVKAAADQGLRVMMDLVINHTAMDSVLVNDHPEWYARDEAGGFRSPCALDPDEPDNPEKRVVWGDLAEIDYANTGDRAALVHYWQQLVRHYARLGFAGFRCDAAYKVPGAIWGAVIAAARQENSQVCFFAETLGCRPREVEQLAVAGFSYLFNSSKWWDFRADWLLEQYEQFRSIAPSVAFPESHDTERLAAESGGDEHVSRLRYLFAAAFSSGVMMPMGYEYGFRRRLDVVHTRPEDWEEPSFDLSDFVGEVNRMKARLGLLNEEGPQRRVTSPNPALVVLVRSGVSAPGRMLTLINPDAHEARRFSPAQAARLLGCAAPQMREPMPGAESREWIDLQPLTMRLFASPDA